MKRRSGAAVPARTGLKDRLSKSSSVSDTVASTAFYERMGFAVSAQSFNQGLEQASLDDIAGVEVDVTALALTGKTPHLELLRYRTSPRVRRAHRSNDIVSTRLVLQSEAAAIDPVRVADCGGHHLLIVRD